MPAPNTLLHDPARLERYLRIVAAQVYAEGDSAMHRQITEQVVREHVEPLGLPKDAAIYDLGCGPGYFLDCMESRGYTNVTGITLSEEDLAACRGRGHRVAKGDISWLDAADASAEFLFVRHAIEHSPFPFLTLLEFNRVLRPGGRVYLEVPAPGCARVHERNPNHYSVLGFTMWFALIERAGFQMENAKDLKFAVQFGAAAPAPVEEVYLVMLARKLQTLEELEAGGTAPGGPSGAP
jgi:ubiquinone/menaquinone biosynthesis C-methylase UbiE